MPLNGSELAMMSGWATSEAPCMGASMTSGNMAPTSSGTTPMLSRDSTIFQLQSSTSMTSLEVERCQCLATPWELQVS